MGAALATCAASSLCECAVCCGCALLNWSLAQARRASHLLILLATFGVAVILGRYYTTELSTYQGLVRINLTSGCDSSYLNECIYRQLVFRAGLSLFVLFLSLACGSYFSEAVDASFWPLKITAAIGVFVAFIWRENETFSQFGEAARVFSFFWLLVQGLLVLEVFHGLHETILRAADEEDRRTGGDSRYFLSFYVFLSVSMLVSSGVGLYYLFLFYSGCDAGHSFTIFTLVVGLLQTILSLLHYVNKGLLTPSFVFAYSTLQTWYSILSSPDLMCNSTANTNKSDIKAASVWVIAIFSTGVVLFCVCVGAKILQIFNPSGQGLLDESKDLEVTLVGSSVLKSTELPYTTTSGLSNRGESDEQEVASYEQERIKSRERVFFHVLMALASTYGTMVLTSWGSTDGSPEQGNAASVYAANESMWLKITALWVTLLLYFKMQHAAFVDNL
jgi:hypothetical protein